MPDTTADSRDSLADLEDPGAFERAVVAALRAIPAVRAVYAISGAFDCLVFVEGETTEEIDGVLDAIGAIPGVGKTQSSLVLSVKFDRH